MQILERWSIIFNEAQPQGAMCSTMTEVAMRVLAMVVVGALEEEDDKAREESDEEMSLKLREGAKLSHRSFESPQEIE